MRAFTLLGSLLSHYRNIFRVEVYSIADLTECQLTVAMVNWYNLKAKPGAEASQELKHESSALTKVVLSCKELSTAGS